MKISKVTLTGADDSIIDPAQLFEISENFPFVEWGILLSRKSQGQNRYPSSIWLKELAFSIRQAKSDVLQFSGHLCGAYVREFLVGDDSFTEEPGLGSVWPLFRRIQINTHGMDHDYHMESLINLINKYGDKEFIFQYDNSNTEILSAVVAAGCKNVSTLFDLSSGAGLLPTEWPMPLNNIRCGYAGGLSPANVGAQISAIADKVDKVVGDREIWIDMETHVRSNDDQLFDLEKCKRVLIICRSTELIEEKI